MFCSGGHGLWATLSKTSGVVQCFPAVGGDPLMSHEINLVGFEKSCKNEVEDEIPEAPWGQR